ncbi:MAG TPA: hypothetical protein VFV07_12360 [Rhizomicrobium sp.]|nr:hypothetical protein [Rhizomicrobium sp.]
MDRKALDKVHDEEKGPSNSPKSGGKTPRNPPPAAPGPGAGTEELLNSLIAECHYAMREVAIPSACNVDDALTRQLFLSEAVSLAQAGAGVGKTVAMLRAADRYAQVGTSEQMDRVLPAIEKNG